jgi:hypothetical protein
MQRVSPLLKNLIKSGWVDYKQRDSLSEIN